MPCFSRTQCRSHLNVNHSGHQGKRTPYWNFNFRNNRCGILGSAFPLQLQEVDEGTQILKMGKKENDPRGNVRGQSREPAERFNLNDQKNDN